MGIFRSTLAFADNQDPNEYRAGSGNPVMRGRDAVSNSAHVTTASSTIVQVGGSDFEVARPGYLTMKCDVACWIHVDPVPVAAINVGFYLEPLERLDLAMMPGDKIAVINA